MTSKLLTCGTAKESLHHVLDIKVYNLGKLFFNNKKGQGHLAQIENMQIPLYSRKLSPHANPLPPGLKHPQ